MFFKRSFMRAINISHFKITIIFFQTRNNNNNNNNKNRWMLRGTSMGKKYQYWCFSGIRTMICLCNWLYYVPNYFLSLILLEDYAFLSFTVWLAVPFYGRTIYFPISWRYAGPNDLLWGMAFEQRWEYASCEQSFRSHWLFLFGLLSSPI